MDIAWVSVISTGIAVVSFLGGGIAVAFKFGQYTGAVKASDETTVTAMEEMKGAVSGLTSECKIMGNELTGLSSSFKENTKNMDGRMCRLETWIDHRVNGTPSVAHCGEDPPKEEHETG